VGNLGKHIPRNFAKEINGPLFPGSDRGYERSKNSAAGKVDGAENGGNHSESLQEFGDQPHESAGGFEADLGAIQ
jgi:hypothetical protein